MSATTITLPGRPVTATLDADALPRYLLARGWAAMPVNRADPTWIRHKRDGREVLLPNPAEGEDDLGVEMSQCIEEVADIEGRHPLDVLADLLPPADGPALQWAHANDDTRAAALADIDAMAAQYRRAAERSRSHGRPVDALAREGRAMGLEAAAAVLRATT